MCNLYSVTSTADEMARLFEVAPERFSLGNVEPLAAVFPKHSAPVVWQERPSQRRIDRMEWGFATPKLSKKTGKPISPYSWNNARDNKVATTRLWAESFRNRRCLVPASSFQESKGKAPATNTWFALKGDRASDRPLFAFAGFWRFEQPEMQDPNLDRYTFTIITTDANTVVRPIHPTRMPVILEPQSYDLWLNGDTEQALALLKPFAAEKMTIARQGVGLWSDPH